MKSKVKIAAIIAEFNPFHNGHKYIIDQARAQTGCTHILIIQSGNFTQRAEPAIINKYARAHAAILCGADAVVEIPAAYATGNAEVFARAAVQIAASIPEVTHLVFGTENKDLSNLRRIAEVQIMQKKAFNKLIKTYIKTGLSYDRARTETIKNLLNNISNDIIESSLNLSNNILAVEYLKELSRLKSQITPLNVIRLGNNYTDTDLSGTVSSASAIRTALEKSDFDLSKYVPESAVEITHAALAHKPDFDLFGASVLYALYTSADVKKTYNYNLEIGSRLTNLRPVAYEELKQSLPNRRFSVSRIARLALHSALGITKRDIKFLYKRNYLPYTNLLAINQNARELFAALCSSAAPLIVRGNKNKPKNNSYTKALQVIDNRAELLYQTVCKTKFENKPVFVRK